MNIANMITIFRIFLIPIYVYVFYNFGDQGIFYAGMIFILAGVSDVLDGHIARKYNMTSDLGAVLDPFADKMMMFTVLISFTHKGIIPPIILIMLGLKELTMIVGGGVLYLFNGKQVIPSNIFGKMATVSFYISTLAVILDLSRPIWEKLFIITVLLNIVAFINYLLIFLRKKQVKEVDKKN